jgi:predicted HD phosphohydrolase
VSIRDHLLQAAQWAVTCGYHRRVIVAALLHDVGHLLEGPQMTSGGESLGRVEHESAGAAYLQSLGFHPDVCELVRLHVTAKRYLYTCLRDFGLEYDLSSASLATLKHQGGRMTEEESWAFLRHRLHDDALLVRECDEHGKKEGLVLMKPLGYYKGMCLEFMTVTTDSTVLHEEKDTVDLTSDGE